MNHPHPQTRTVGDVETELRLLRQRAALLAQLQRELSIRYGREAQGDPDLLHVSGSWERPHRDVVAAMTMDLSSLWSKTMSEVRRLQQLVIRQDV